MKKPVPVYYYENSESAYRNLKGIEREINERNNYGESPREELEPREPMTVKDKRDYSGDDPKKAVSTTYRKD